MPRAGTITSISAYFSNSTTQILIGNSVFVTAQLYESTTPNDAFSPVLGASVTLAPALANIAPVGTLCNGTTSGLNISVTNQTRLMMVYSVTSIVPGTAVTVTGYGSAGVSIQ
jgi:BclB C-terminal domain-containing protein